MSTTVPRSLSHKSASTSGHVRHPHHHGRASLPYKALRTRHMATVNAVASPVARFNSPTTSAAATPRPALSFHTIPQALDAIAQGHIVVVCT